METAYMWERDLPYKQFLPYYIYAKNIGYERGWVEAGAIYEKYANMLIRKYPGRYFSRYIIPSFLSNFKCHPISEESTVFKNEPIYRDYFGIQEETFTYNHHFFYDLTPVRKIANYFYWTILGLEQLTISIGQYWDYAPAIFASLNYANEYLAKPNEQQPV